MRWTAITLGPLVALTAAIAVHGNGLGELLRPAPIAIVGFVVATALLWRLRLSYRIRAWAYVAALMVMAAISFMSIGPVAGPTGLGIMAVLASAVLLGQRAWLLSAFILTAVLLGLGASFSSGFISETRGLTNVADPKLWVRTAVAFACVSTAMSVLVLHVVRQLERYLEESNRTVAALRAEEERRQRTEGKLERTESALAEAQKLELVGQVAGGVAHDLNNALVILHGWVDIFDLARASDERIGPETASSLEEGVSAMRSALEQAHGVTRQLLTLGRRDVASPEPVEIERSLSRLKASLRRILPEDVEFVVRCEQPPVVFIDHVQFHQVVLNLVLNARDAVGADGRIEITATGVSGASVPDHDRMPSRGRWLHLRVADNGPGVPEAMRERVLDPFFTTKAGAGTGLGLATANAIIGHAGGLLRVDPNATAGATIDVFLPECSRGLSRGVATHDSPAAPKPRGTVLVVEDEPRVLEVMSRALRGGGFSVIEANGTKEGLERIRRTAADLSLLCTDAIMPGPSVGQLIDAFRAAHPDAPVLVCSGHVEEEITRRRIYDGDYAFLAKPFSGSDLVDKVRSVIGEGAPLGSKFVGA